MFGLELDEYFGAPLLLQRVMICILALTITILHPLVAYVLLFQSKSLNTEMRVGYLVLQFSQVLQDVFFCLLFQPYLLTPLPVFGCMGLLCDVDWLPPVHIMGMLGIFINLSIVIYLSLLLRIQQSLIVGQSPTKLSSRYQLLVIFVIASGAVWVVLEYFRTAAEHFNRSEIIRELNVSWLEQYSRHVIVMGSGIGDTGTVRKAMLKLAIYDVFWYTTMAILIFLILRELKRHAKFESAQKRLCRTARALLSELLIGGLLYIFPTLTMIFLSFCPPLFIPDVFYFSVRIVFVLCFSVQSIASSLIFLSYHHYGKELRKRLFNYVSRQEDTTSSV